MNDRAFYVDTDVPQEILVDLAAAVDALDWSYIVIQNEVMEPVEDRTLDEYLQRATKYLEAFKEWLEAEDIRRAETAPLSESQRRARISKILRATLESKQS